MTVDAFVLVSLMTHRFRGSLFAIEWKENKHKYGRTLRLVKRGSGCGSEYGVVVCRCGTNIIYLETTLICSSMLRFTDNFSPFIS